MSNLDRKGFIINIENGKAEIIKNNTIVRIANQDRNLYKLTINIKEVDDSGAYSAVNMNNSKIWHSRMGHIGHNQLQQLAKTVLGMNIKANRDVTEVCETCVNCKQTQVPHKQTKVNARRLFEKIHSNVSTEEKQDERMSVMESCNGKDRCVLEDNKTKRKKKQKERIYIAQMHKKRKLKQR
jgi:hypothetical protein